MANAALLKGGVIVVVLLAALVAFDAYTDFATSRITGAAISASGGATSRAEVSDETGSIRDVLDEGDAKIYRLGGRSLM